MSDLARAANLLESGGYLSLAASVRAAMDQIERSELDREERAELPPSRIGYLERRLAELAERVAALESPPSPMVHGPFDAVPLVGSGRDWHITDALKCWGTTASGWHERPWPRSTGEAHGPFSADTLAGSVWDWHSTDVANVKIGDYLLDGADEFRQVASKVTVGESVGFEYLCSTDGAGNDQYRLIWAGPVDSRISVYTPVARK